MTSMRIMSPSGSTTRRSGCVRSTTRRASPSRAPANANAASVFPTPAGPWKRKAWASPPARAAVSNRLASTCSGIASKGPIDLLGEQLGARRSVDDDEPVRFALGELPVSAGGTGVKVVFLALDSVALAAHAPDGIVRADLEQDRAVGHQPLHGGEVELEHALEAEPAGDALVGDRRVDVAVADHRRPTRERGPDELLDVLGTRCRVERSL